MYTNNHVHKALLEDRKEKERERNYMYVYTYKAIVTKFIVSGPRPHLKKLPLHAFLIPGQRSPRMRSATSWLCWFA